MSPKKSGSRTKKATGLAQPTLTFQSRKPTAHDGKSTSRPSTVPVRTTSDESIPVDEDVGEITPRRPEAEKENLNIAETSVKRRQLDPKSKAWEGVWRDAKAQMGGMKPIHAGPESHDNVHHILRVFDMTSKYGPSVGITRLQRWERAKKWGLNPPDEIRQILTTQQGEDDPSYRENVLHGWLG